MFFLVLEDVRWFWQEGNVKNQREHLVLLLANAQMRLQPQATNRLDAKVVKKIRKKVTANYVSWCNFIRQRSNLELTEEDERLELLYTALFLLIWGESANLRFMPECLCYMFHHVCLVYSLLILGNILMCLYQLDDDGCASFEVGKLVVAAFISLRCHGS
jgi:callose synthase